MDKRADFVKQWFMPYIPDENVDEPKSTPDIQVRSRPDGVVVSGVYQQLPGETVYKGFVPPVSGSINNHTYATVEPLPFKITFINKEDENIKFDIDTKKVIEYPKGTEKYFIEIAYIKELFKKKYTGDIKYNLYTKESGEFKDLTEMINISEFDSNNNINIYYSLSKKIAEITFIDITNQEHTTTIGLYYDYNIDINKNKSMQINLTKEIKDLFRSNYRVEGITYNLYKDKNKNSLESEVIILNTNSDNIEERNIYYEFVGKDAFKGEYIDVGPVNRGQPVNKGQPVNRGQPVENKYLEILGRSNANQPQVKNGNQTGKDIINALLNSSADQPNIVLTVK